MAYLPSDICIEETAYKPTYQHSNIYLGRGNTLPKKVYVSLKFIFTTDQQMKDFFTWWKDVINYGERPFYAPIKLFGDTGGTTEYLIAQEGELSESHSPHKSVSGKFLYMNRRRNINFKPITQDITKAYSEGSKNNFIVLLGSDDNNDVLSYSIVDDCLHGVIEINTEGTVLYTPTTAYEGIDTFTYRAFDGLAYSDKSTVTITMSPRDTENFWVLDSGGASYVRFTDSGGNYILTKEDA